eukprot:jgi/Galph1/2674/GphlegSOOS_G1330.1
MNRPKFPEQRPYRVVYCAIGLLSLLFSLVLVQTLKNGPSWFFGYRDHRLDSLSEESWMTGDESGFEFFVINRKDREDRWMNFQKNVEQKLQHEIRRVEAVEVDGNWTEVVSNRAAMTVKRPYRGNHEDIANWNAVSCYLTHRKVWEQVLQFQRNSIVFEDDASFRKRRMLRYRFLAELEDVFTKYPNAVVFLGYLSIQAMSGFSWKPSKQVSRHYLDITGNSATGTHAYAIAPRAAEFLMNTSLPVEVQIDAFLCYAAFRYPEKVRIFVRRSSMFSQSFHASDIQSICFRCILPFETPTYIITIIASILLCLSLYYRYSLCASRQTIWVLMTKKSSCILEHWMKEYRSIRAEMRRKL